ncbi:MAG: hypothetical protein JSR37_05225 [Verrucomicrobia bacterium]|nr:hypothetical protein [Verrucomicrobiota bacterium]MBS0636128.1 hypothetical protein [Verrucomicrobiota bacterium]
MMIGTVLSIVVAAVSLMRPEFTLSQHVWAGNLLLLFVAFLALIVAHKSVMRAETKVMGSAQALFIKDRKIPFLFAALFALLLISFIAPAYVAVVAFGIGFDLLYALIKRLFSFTQMPFLIDMAAHDLEKSEESKVYEYLEVVVDATAKAINKGQTFRASTSLKAIQTLIEGYVRQVAQAGMRNPGQNGGLTFLDKVNSLAIFVSERLLWLFERAIKAGMQPACENIISELGRMSVFFARYNADVAAIPVAFLDKCAAVAKTHEQTDLLIRIALTLSETTKQLLAYSKEKNESFRDLIMTSLVTLEQNVKTIWRQNREANVVLLMQPFAEIGEFIGSDQMKTFPDRDEVIKQIRRVLTEFQALQVVTKNVETMAPHVGEDSASSYQEDMK